MTLKDFLSEEKRAFNERWNKLGSFVILGKDGRARGLPSIESFLEASHRRLLQQVVEMAEGSKKHIGQKSTPNKSGKNKKRKSRVENWNTALDTVISLLKDI